MPSRRTFGSIYQDGRVRISQNTPVNNFNPQGTAKAFLDVLGLEMERLYDNMEVIYRALDPTRAVGRDLDKLGFLVGEIRQNANVAADFSETNFYFFVDRKLNWTVQRLIQEIYTQEEINVLDTNGYLTKNADGTIASLDLPTGLTVSNNNKSINYRTNTAVAMAGASDAYVGVTATTSGPENNVESNTLVQHSLTSIPELRKLARYIKCSNRFPIQNGRYSQTDEEFRYSISTASSAIPTNELAIRRIAVNLPGIRNILFEKNKFGSGTVNIIVDGISPLVSDGLVSSMRQILQDNGSYGDVFFVHKPQYLGVELNFSVRVDPGTQDPLGVRNEARDSIIQYINDLQIGEEIVWDRIVSIVLAIEGVIDFIPNYFKYGKYDPVHKLNKEQIVLRFINQRARYNEKWYTDTGLVSCCIV